MSQNSSSSDFIQAASSAATASCLSSVSKVKDGENSKCNGSHNCTSSFIEENVPPQKGGHIAELLKKEANYDVNDNSYVKKRKGYLEWDEYFMSIAFLSAQRSKDPNEQSGAVIVDDDNRIVGIGYNGFPSGCSDDALPWAKADANTEEILHTKNPFMCHAAVNAILNKSSSDVNGARLYLQDFPCNESTKIIIQSGIREIIYIHCKNPDDDSIKASRIMLHMASVKIRQYLPTLSKIRIDFGINDWIESTSSKASSGARVTEEYRDLMMKEAGYDPSNVEKTKRSGYLSWDDYFTSVACLSAKRSKDPNTQVGCCIVDARKRIIGLGYNGFPRGCSDDYLPWSRHGLSSLHTKYPFVVHAEANAILNKGAKDLNGATMYVALFPCNECAKLIIQAGIKKLVYLQDKYHDTNECRASRIMFEMSGVSLHQHQPTKPHVDIQMNAVG